MKFTDILFVFLIGYSVGLEYTSCHTITCGTGNTSSECISISSSDGKVTVTPCSTGLQCQDNGQFTSTTGGWNSSNCTTATSQNSTTSLIRHSAAGYPCTSNSDCASNSCQNGICQGIPEGQNCTQDDECQPSHYCYVQNTNQTTNGSNSDNSTSGNATTGNNTNNSTGNTTNSTSNSTNQTSGNQTSTNSSSENNTNSSSGGVTPSNNTNSSTSTNTTSNNSGSTNTSTNPTTSNTTTTNTTTNSSTTTSNNSGSNTTSTNTTTTNTSTTTSNNSGSNTTTTTTNSTTSNTTTDTGSGNTSGSSNNTTSNGTTNTTGNSTTTNTSRLLQTVTSDLTSQGICMAANPVGTACSSDSQCQVGYGCNNLVCTKLFSVAVGTAASSSKFCVTNLARNGVCEGIVIVSQNKTLSSPYQCSIGTECIYQYKTDGANFTTDHCQCDGISTSVGYCGMVVGVIGVWDQVYPKLQYTASNCSGTLTHTDDVQDLVACGSLSNDTQLYYNEAAQEASAWTLYQSGAIDKCASSLGLFDPNSTNVASSAIVLVLTTVFLVFI